MIRKIFKTLVFSLIVLFGATIASAQDVADLTSTRSNMLKREYLRPSVSNIYITDGSSIAQQAVDYLKGYEDKKFDRNEIATTDIQLNGLVDFSSDESVAKLRNLIEETFKEAKVGNQIMHCWFPKFENGMYSSEVLMARGRFGATDDQVVQANATYRGKEVMLNMLGEQLIDRSYAVVYYIYNTKTEKGIDFINMEAFVYKLNFNAAVMNEFYTKNFNAPDGIDRSEFPMTFVYGTNKKSNGLESYIGVGSHSMMLSKDVSVIRATENLYETINVQIGQHVSDFQVKTSIAALNPIGAKVGTKENLRTDRRFYVMENVLNDKGESISKRRGAVRVGTYIADNYKIADGSSTDYTRFYQYFGGRLEEGMTLVEMPDLGVGITPVVNYMYVGMEVDYRAGDLLRFIMKKKGTLPGLFTYVRFALPFGTKASKGNFGIVTLPGENDKAQPLLRYSFGARKEFNFFRTLNASVCLGYGMYGLPERYKHVSWSYLEAAARLGIYVHPNINIFVLAGYELTFFSQKGDSSVISNGNKINEFFGISPFNFGVGTRFSF